VLQKDGVALQMHLEVGFGAEIASSKAAGSTINFGYVSALELRAVHDKPESGSQLSPSSYQCDVFALYNPDFDFTSS
jgi:hypothetical protein